MGIECKSGVTDKALCLSSIISETEKLFGTHIDSREIAYIGNDVNDLEAMKLASHRFVPQDGHPAVIAEATKVFKETGGNGFVRAVVEYLLIE